MPDEERRLKIEKMDPCRPRVLVATDCLSEGINLQDKFTAVLHYDLPWNPNRLEQREGRVDRYGQTAKKVRAIRFYGRDNPVDGAVIEVLLDKAREIHQALGTHVPVPEESESVIQAVLNALFLRSARQMERRQLVLDLGVPEIAELHRRWEKDRDRERINRTRFAQRALKPEEVRRELEATDTVLGDPEAVRQFVLSAAQRLGLTIRSDSRNPQVYHVPIDPNATTHLPEPIRFALSYYPPLAGRAHGAISTMRHSPSWLISFSSPTPEGAEYLGRNHRFVTALAGYLLEEALTKCDNAVASRCGVLRTRAVTRLTILLLLRIRYLIEQPQKAPLLSEEVGVLGYEQPSVVWAGPRACPDTPSARWLSDDEALRLLAEAKPDANVPLAEKQELVRMVLNELGEWRSTHGEWNREHPIQQDIRERILARASALEESHRRIRQAVSLRVRELAVNLQFPPDFLGLLVLQPVVTP
jgi:hypothetical protein